MPCATPCDDKGDREKLNDRIGAMMAPRSVAVIGASSRRHTLGNQVLKNLREFGFEGTVTGVHPSADTIEGWPTVPAVSDLPSGVDVAVASIPAAGVPELLVELERQGCRSAIVPAAGFTGETLDALEQVTRVLDLRYTGPNCLGVFSATARAPLWTPGFRMDFPRGDVAIVSQSGSAAISITTTPGLGFSRVVSSGNETSLTSADYLEWLAEDDATRAVGLVIESIRDPVAFEAAVARMHEAGKVVVALKVGRTPQGSLAALAHTGALVTNYDAYRAFFRRIGVPAVLDYDEMFGCLQCAIARPVGRWGPRVGVLAISGGQGALAADLVVESGLTLAPFTGETRSRLRQALPDVSGDNPVDIGATVGVDRRNPRDALLAMLDDPGVDTVLAIQDAHERLALWDEHTYVRHVRSVVEIARQATKPIVLASSSAAPIHPLLQEVVNGSPVPFLRGLGAAVAALGGMDGSGTAEAPAGEEFSPDGLPELRADLHGVEGPLPYRLTQRILDAYRLPTVESVLVSGTDEAVKAAVHVGYPLVAKIASPDVTHRGDVGGVVVGIGDPAELLQALRSIQDNVRRSVPRARIEGFELQPYVPGGVEAILGFKDEPPIGPVVMTGAGGSLTELIHDRQADLAPLSMADAQALIAATALGRVLLGYRNLVAPTDVRPLADVLRRLGTLAMDLHDLVTVAEFNPALIASPSGQVRIVDALFIGRG